MHIHTLDVKTGVESDRGCCHDNRFNDKKMDWLSTPWCRLRYKCNTNNLVVLFLSTDNTIQIQYTFVYFDWSHYGNDLHI